MHDQIIDQKIMFWFNSIEGKGHNCFASYKITFGGSLKWEALLKTFVCFRHQVGFYNSFFNVIKDVFWVGTLVFLWHHHDSRDKWIVCRPPISSIKCQSEPMKIFLFWFRNVSFFRNNWSVLGIKLPWLWLHWWQMNCVRPLVLTWWPRGVGQKMAGRHEAPSCLSKRPKV